MNPSQSPSILTQDGETSFTVGRLVCKLRLPDGLPDPAGVRDRLARLAEEELAEMLAAQSPDLTGGIPGNDQAVYRIRSLSLNLWVDVRAMPSAEIGQRWCAALLAATTRAIQTPDSSQVVRFDTPRHYVTAFFRDLLDGRAWGCWYYAEFQNLQRLAVPEITAMLLALRPDWIAPLLLDLETTGHAARLIQGWDAGQIERLWRALGFSTGPHLPPAAGLFDELRTVWQEIGSAGMEEVSRARARLRAWLALARRGSALAGDAHTAGWLAALVDLAALLHNHPDLSPLLLMESGLYPKALDDLANTPFGGMRAWLGALSQSESGRRALRQLAEAADSEAAGKTSRTASLSSALGSVCLLLPALAESGLWQLWRDADGEETARAYLFYTLLKTLGNERVRLAYNDPLLAAIAGVDAAPDLSPPPRRRPEMNIRAKKLRRVNPAKHPPAAAKAGFIQRRSVARTFMSGRVKGAIHTRAKYPTVAETPRQSDDAYFHLGADWLPPYLDAALSAAAALVMRRFAHTLAGFAAASPAYLARQFLAQPAELLRGATHWQARLSGGPLRVVLQLSALPEEVDVPWLPLPVKLALL